MRRSLALLIATVAALGALLAPSASTSAATIPIGGLGEPFRVEFKGPVADVTVECILSAPVPPGFGHPRALQLAMQSAWVGQTFSGGVWRDCYRDVMSNVVLPDKITATRLAQWNVA